MAGSSRVARATLDHWVQAEWAPAPGWRVHGAGGVVTTSHSRAYSRRRRCWSWVCRRKVSQLEGVEFYGNLSCLKAGLHYADHITTVSPSYAEEIQTEELGFGLQGLLASRRTVLTGILNGIDTSEWNPAADTNLVQPYDAEDLRGKAANKLKLQKRMGLRPEAGVPLFGLVSRFTHQKGLDVVLEIAPQWLRCRRNWCSSAPVTRDDDEPSLAFISMSYDHRLVDGELGGQFMQKLVEYLEGMEGELL